MNGGVGESSDHTFKWNYSKDKAVDHGLDCGWVDRVTWQRKTYISFLSSIRSPAGDLDYYYYTNLVAYAGDLHPSAPIPVRTGYTFDGWYRQTWKHDYSGYETNWYSEAVAVTGTVYNSWQANWVANTYSVAFDSNCGTGETVLQRFTYDVEQSLTGNTFIREGYTFLGWATDAAGDVVYGDSESVKNLTAVDKGTVWLYAVWKPNSCTVSFDANGGYGWMNTQRLTHGVPATLKKNAFRKTGHHFAGWAISADGAVAYSDAQDAASLTLSPNETVTLYAVWDVNSYSVTFNANGGSGIIPPQPFTYGVEQVLQTNTFLRSGYAFAGWALTPDGGVTYEDASKVKNLSATMDATVELFAVWDEDPEPGSYRLYVEDGVLKRWRTDGATDIVIPDGVRVIAPDVFYHTNVTSVVFPDSLQEIHGWAFAGCNLTNIVWGTGLLEIGAGAFSFNKNLSGSIVLPDGVQTVDSYAFDYCTSLKRIDIPSSVTKMGVGVFMSCSSLQLVTFHGDAPQVQTYLSGNVLNGLYTGTPTSLITYVPQDSTGWFDESDYKPPMWPLDGSEARTLRCSEDWPTAPTVRILDDEGWGVGLFWDYLPEALSYEVYRSWWYQPDEVLADGLMNGWFVDTTALAGVSYWYWVAAVDADGNRAYSEAVRGRREVSLSLGEEEISLDALAGSEMVDVHANTSWRAVSSASWLELTTSSGNGDGLLSYAFTHNFSRNARTATITVTAGEGTSCPKTQTIHVLQSGWNGGVSLEAEEYSVVAGVQLDGSEIVPEVAEGYTLKVAGLPSGMRYDARTGMIVGTPKAKAGSYTVTFTASKKGEKNQVATVTLEVAALPDWATGTFAGLVEGALDARPCHGSATMTVAANGKVSGKIALDGTNWTFSAASYAVVERPSSDVNDASFIVAATAKAGKLTRPVSIAVRRVADGRVPLPDAVAEGTFGDCEARMWRNMWKDKTTAAAAKAEIAKWEGVYTLSMEDGGYMSLTIGKNGDVKASGKLSDGTRISATSPLMYDTDFGYFAYLYAAPSVYKGGCLALAVGFDGAGARDARPYRLAPVMFGPQWTSRNPQATGAYGEGFERSPGFTGAYYDKLATLYDYYESLRLSMEAVPSLAYNYKETRLGDDGRKVTESRTEEAGAVDTFNQDGLTVSVDEKGKLVVTKATRPMQDKETKEWSYDGANDGAMTLSFTQATGIFKGSYTFWYDYVSAVDATTGKETNAHTSKKASFEGIMVQGAESMRGFFLWDATGAYEDPKTGKAKTYRYKESYRVQCQEQ